MIPCPNAELNACPAVILGSFANALLIPASVPLPIPPNAAAATQLILRYPEIFKDYEITEGKMDDIFLRVTGKNLEGGEEQ